MRLQEAICSTKSSRNLFMLDTPGSAPPSGHLLNTYLGNLSIVDTTGSAPHAANCLTLSEKNLSNLEPMGPELPHDHLPNTLLLKSIKFGDCGLRVSKHYNVVCVLQCRHARVPTWPFKCPTKMSIS